METTSSSGAVSAVPKTRVDGSRLVACFPDEYEKLFSVKIDKLKELLSWTGPVDSFESPKFNYRMRTNFQMWHDDAKNRTPEGFFYAMYDEENRNVPMEVKSFPRGTLRINELMTGLMEIIHESKEIFDNLFEVRFVTTQTSDAVIVLCYKKPLVAGWKAAAEIASAKLNAKIVGRARKEKQVAGGEETVLEVLNFQGRPFKFYQTEGAFSQPNAAVCEKMVGWSLDMTKDSKDTDLLELYCGGGTFTAPLSQNFRKVLATEISKASVELATKSFALNGVENVSIARLSSEEFSEAYSGRRTFQRLTESKINLRNFNISTVFVDPPRSGLDNDTCSMIAQFERIVYISCNPVTLARDVAKLALTHDVVRVAAFDQFPYTHHLEGGVFLVRKAVAAVAAVAESKEGDEQEHKKQRVEE